MLLHEETTKIIIKCFYAVYNELGFGFLEKVYERSFAREIQSAGLSCVTQSKIDVYYKDGLVGEYFADIVVDRNVIIEIKAASSLIAEHESQLLNYLKATDIEVGLLFNFGENPEFKRKIFNNNSK